MSKTSESRPGSTAPPGGRGPAGAVAPRELPLLVERLRALQSAWGVLAPSCLSSSGEEIVQAGRALRKELIAAVKDAGCADERSLIEADERLDWLENSISRVAFELPPPQFRSTLPGLLRSDRRGLLDLLDVLARDAFESPTLFAAKLGILDYLITLLCTDGDSQGRVMPRDPAMLTPDFQALCERAEEECQERLSEIEAEFFAAANLEADIQNEIQLRELRARKAALGRIYFAPRMLRAIVTYNVALTQCVAAQVWESRDWGDVPDAEEAPAHTSVFDSNSVASLHEALLRRLQGGPPEPDPVGRVAWALDLDYLTSSERSILREGSIAPSDPQTSILLVGLLCRSLNVLAIELQDIDIDPDEVSERWVEELDELIKEQVNHSISGDAYKQACLLSQLRNKFLYAPMLDVYRDHRGEGPRPSAPSTGSEERQIRKEARALASEALAETSHPRTPRSDDEAALTWREWPWRVLAPVGLTMLLAMLMGLQHFGVIDLLGRDLDRWSSSELESVSPHLVRGHRTGNGRGIAFVGTIGEDWLALEQQDRLAAAEELVRALRVQGVVQVMIYDDEKQLRIQSLGERVRVL